jgi:hypothetical protein
MDMGKLTEIYRQSQLQADLAMGIHLIGQQESTAILFGRIYNVSKGKNMIRKLVLVGMACLFTANISGANAEKLQNNGAQEQSKVAILQMPGWVGDKSTGRVCSIGMRAYKAKILTSAALGGRPPLSKASYYAYATYLGYFSDDPVQKDEIVEKVRSIVDRDLLAMSEMVRKGAYFLYVGEVGSVLNNDITQMNSPVNRQITMPNLVEIGFQGPYNWETNSFEVADATTGLSSNFSRTITASPKEWKEKWQPIFAPENRHNLAGRLLIDRAWKPVFAEIFDKRTGQTIVKWGVAGTDVERMSAFIKETPAADYDLKNCGDLNPSYFTASEESQNDSNETDTDDPKKAVGNFFNSIFKK